MLLSPAGTLRTVRHRTDLHRVEEHVCLFLEDFGLAFEELVVVEQPLLCFVVDLLHDLNVIAAAK